MLFERGLVCDDPQKWLITKPLSNNFCRHYPVVKKVTKVGHIWSRFLLPDNADKNYLKAVS